MTDLTKIDKPFGELDRETKGALLLAAHEGVEIECSIVGGTWGVEYGCLWSPRWVYRVKPVPLTPDTLDWSQVAEGWDWMARDLDGRAYFFQRKPTRDGRMWIAGRHRPVPVVVSSYRRGTCDWKDSLITRPGKE